MTAKRAARGEVKAAILKLLECAPSGKSARQVGLALGRDRSQMLTRLAELAQQGKVVSVAVQSTGRPTQLWFHAKHRDQAEHAGPLGWGGTKAKRARTVAQALAPKPTRRQDGDGPIVVTAAPFVDSRFAVDRVEPFFSRPGYRPEFIGKDTAIARYLAARETA